MTIPQNLEKAFDYRGDVTVDLNNGSSMEGYLFNRDDIQQTVQIFLKDQPAPKSIPYADIREIRFTGENTAAGKSWEAWKAKKETQLIVEKT